MLNKRKENDSCFKAYAIDIEADDCSALSEFPLLNKQIKTKFMINVVITLAECNEQMYPWIYGLSIILDYLPVTPVTSERLFSTFRRLKVYRRNTICENRLDGLTVLNIYGEIEVSVKEVVENQG